MTTKWNITWGERAQELPDKPFTGKHLINNQWRDSQDGATMECRSPAYAIPVGEYAKGNEKEVDGTLDRTFHKTTGFSDNH